MMIRFGPVYAWEHGTFAALLIYILEKIPLTSVSKVEEVERNITNAHDEMTL